MSRLFPDIPISYQTNAEYRRIFRQITRMDNSKYYNNIQHLPDLDEETLDEYNYDEASVSTFIDHIVSLTIHHPAFQTLYDAAAAKMFSTDREIGITILLSYDYFRWFYPLLCLYEHSPHVVLSTHEYYTRLLSALEGRR